MTAMDHFFSTVFLVWFLGCYVFLVQGVPNRDIAEDHIRTRKDTESSKSATFDDNVESPGAPTKYEIISQSFVEQPNTKVLKECDDEEECEPGSGDSDRIPIIQLLPALKKDSIPVDAFIGDVSNNKKDDVTYEMISKSSTTKEKSVSGKACDDEDECGSADDTFDNKGVGEEIVGGLSPQKPKDVLSGDATYYKVISKSMVEKDESKQTDVFTAEKASKNKNGEVKYEIISKSMTNGNKVPPKKNCDDEDECGSADDVFSNDDSSERINKGLSLSDNQEPTPTDVSAREKAPENENSEVKYQIISQSMTDRKKAPPKKDCDDEDECGSAVDDVFKNDDNSDGILKGVSLPEDKETTPTDVSATERTPENEDAEVKYEMISKSLTNGNKVTPKKDCDDEDECGSAVDSFSNDDRSDGKFKGLSPSKDKESLAKKTIHYEVISKSTIEKEDSKPTDAFFVGESSSSSPNKENTKVTYEIISKSMINGDKKLSGKDCDDENKCGNVDDGGGDGGGDECDRAPSPPKDQDLTLTNAFTTEEPSKGSSEKDNGDATYEIISKSMTNEKKVPFKKVCDDEDECGSADDAFSNDDSSDGIIKGLTLPKDKEPTPTDVSTTEKTHKNDDGEVKYEIISKSLTNVNKPSSTKDCDDEDGCDDAFGNGGGGSGDGIIDGRSSKEKEIPLEKTAHYEVISKTMGKKDDSKLTDAFTSEKSSGSTSKKENGDNTYEIISQSMTNGDKALPSKRNCDDEDECGSADVFINDGDGEEFVNGHSPPKDTDKPKKTAFYEVLSKSMLKKDDSTPTDTFIAGEPSSSSPNEDGKDAVYEMISESMTKGDKVEPNKNCDDEDECGSADDAFSNNDGAEYKVIKELSLPENKGGLSEKKPHYEMISKKVMEKENPTLTECDDDDEDCQLLNGGSGEDTFDAGRELSPPKFQIGPQLSVESTLQPLFRGTSFLELPPLGKDAQDSIEAELEIFPLERTGVLLYNGWQPNRIGDFISLSIRDGLVELSFDCRSGPIKIWTMESIEMNKWNKIKFFRSGRLGSLTLNDEYSAMGFSPEPRSSLVLSNNLMVGGMPEEMQSEVEMNVGIDKGFTGYIRNLNVQGKTIDLKRYLVKETMKKNYCLPSPCENGGQCIENGNDYSCLCEDRYRGRHCNEEINLQPISFHRESYVRFNKAALLKILEGKDGRVSFSILTTQSRGLLLWEAQKLTEHFQRYATVGLKVGFVSLRFNLGTGRREVDSALPVNDGEWHDVTIARRKGSCVLIIDNQHKTRFNSFNNKMPMEANVNLYIGGVPNIKSETQGLHKTGFKGCLKKFKINTDYIDFARDYIASQGTGYCDDT